MDRGIIMDDFNHQQMQIPPSIMIVPSPSPSIDDFSLALLVERQKQEIEHYLHQQSLNVRVAMQQLSKRQYTSLIRRMEIRASAILKRKDAELAMMSNRVVELEGHLRKKEEEKDLWEKLAREKEALALSLSNALDQLRNPCSSSSSSPSSESSTSCEENGRRGWCRICGVRDCCVVFWPCRHLCSCGLCEGLVDCCPVCKGFKESSVEVYCG